MRPAIPARSVFRYFQFNGSQFIIFLGRWSRGKSTKVIDLEVWSLIVKVDITSDVIINAWFMDKLNGDRPELMKAGCVTTGARSKSPFGSLMKKLTLR